MSLFERNFNFFYAYVTVHRDKFLIIKPTRCTNFSHLFLELRSTCFGQFLCHHQKFFTVNTAMVYGIQICRHILSRIRILILLDFSREKGPKLSPEQRDR
jgi:hypothetical protein